MATRHDIDLFDREAAFIDRPLIPLRRSFPELKLVFEHITARTQARTQGVNMAYILQVDFSMDGPFGADMAQAFEGLARSINQEAGMRWKIWTEDAEAREAGGVYLFDTRENAQRYLDMHAQRLTQSGVRNIRGRIYAVNAALTAINHGPV